MFFDRANWWDPWSLYKDPRFRVLDPIYYEAVACLNASEMHELQNRFRARATAGSDWLAESQRLDSLLAGAKHFERWWMVEVFEWESGID
ncbi:MAG TPA: hypothetical protein VG675_06200 [Bryobacteraceae bacterium]|nr:hypothetical protein [Bryobacteraceae bacterium]